MTAPRVRRPLLRAAAFGALAATLVFVACEAPQPTQPPSTGASFSKSALTPKAAVASFFPDVATKGTGKDDILLFVVSADGEVLRHAWLRDAPDPTVPVRGVGDPRLRPLMEPFRGMVDRAQLVEFKPGEVGPTGTRVIWTQLRPGPGSASRAAEGSERAVALRDAVRRHYPAAQRDAGVTAQVGVSFTVGADGKARGVKVIDRDLDPAFARAALAVVADLTFTPTAPDEETVMVVPFAPERRPAPDAR